MKDLHSNIKVSRAISPAAIVAGNVTTTSQIIDRADYDSLEFVTAFGAFTDSTQTPTMYEGDASNMSDETAVAAADVLGTVAAVTTTAANTVVRHGYKGSKRYVRMKWVQSGATTGNYMSAVAVQGHPHAAPVA